MSQLVQTPSGDWIKPESITGIFAYEPIEPLFRNSKTIGWRVVVHQDGGNAADCFNCQDEVHAKAVRDAFVVAVNAELSSNAEATTL